ncbi:Metal tolerance protein 6 [Fasciola gigantica]|uniref:Metal tolerance protein 6 n=1 Tax=Fasciola gigantica TaxID=46835 RepID=A0A504Z590_FASGI|nr:Metal tolerance protein 6 [Fasciola gigantica]
MLPDRELHINRDGAAANKISGEEDTELTQRLYVVQQSDSDTICNIEHGGVVPRSQCESVNNWQTHPIELFLPHLSENVVELKKLPRKIRVFYQKQDAHIQELVKLSTLEADDPEESASSGKNEVPSLSNRRLNSIILRSVLLVNLLLLLGKSVASAVSGSLSIISSLLDSCVDIASGGIMWFTARQMRKRRPYTYPQGRTRFEPIAIIVLAVFMSTVCLQLSAEAVEAIYRMSKGEKDAPDVTNLTLGIMAVTIALLITDPRYRNLKFLDPIGALLISCYILYSWYQIAAEQTRNLAGHTADPKFLQKIAFVSLNHHSAIERLDTIRAFHFGSHFLVEVDIVLPMGMCLKEAHDIGEELQKKLERLENVERAFVHLDYEFTHHPESEHKIA